MHSCEYTVLPSTSAQLQKEGTVAVLVLDCSMLAALCTTYRPGWETNALRVAGEVNAFLFELVLCLLVERGYASTKGSPALYSPVGPPSRLVSSRR